MYSKLFKIFWISIFILVFVFSCSVNRSVENTNSKSNPFFAYNFGGLEELMPEEQIQILKNNGYDGIVLQMTKAKDVDQLAEFIEVADNTKGFKIFAVFVRYNFTGSEEDRNRWQKVVDFIENKEIALWFIFGKQETGIDDTVVENTLRNVVNYADKYHVPVTLYPHSWCYFYSAEQALPIIKKINNPNLKLAVHSYHEMRAGNGGRLDEVIANVKDYISFVTIAGADREINMNSHRTMDESTIQPLEDGTYDFSKFLTALKIINYKGPVGFMNFHIKIAPEDYLPKTMQEWKRIKNKYLNYKK